MQEKLVSSVERVCWTRMQAEAGQGLARIVARKEMERRAGEGLFFWGVGNAAPRATPALAKLGAPVDVIFSVMKTKPKNHDVSPERVVAWRSYVGLDGSVRPLPRHVLVTSRAGSRDCHYALICRSETPLEVGDHGAFDPSAYRNIGGGGAVGASQVTALLERSAVDGPTDYKVAMRAQLTAGLWVKLIDAVEVPASARTVLDEVPSSVDDWIDLASRVRTGPRQARMAPTSPQHALFAI